MHNMQIESKDLGNSELYSLVCREVVSGVGMGRGREGWPEVQ